MVNANGQKRVALHHNGNTTIFGGANPFLDAYNASVSGDTIYLPGGGLNCPNIISKKLVIFGAGIYNDSTTATGKTIFNNGFTIDSLASNSQFEGLFINGTVTFAINQKIDSVTFRRNYVSGSIFTDGTLEINQSKGIRIESNFINGIVSAQHTSGIIISNNVMNNISSVKNGWIRNNLIFYTGYGNMMTSVQESLVENNFFEGGWGFSNVMNCTFNYNVFGWDPTGDVNNIWNNSYVNVSSNIFYNFQISSNFNTANYHLINPSLYQGTTGNEIGLYGGFDPIKEGVVPMNPHIQSKTIAPNTDAFGNLNINIQVGAQNE